MSVCPVTRRGATVTLSLSAAARPGVKLCLCSAALLCTALHCTVLYCAGVMCEYGRVKGHPATLGTTLTFGPAIYYIYIYVDYLLLTALHCTIYYLQLIY